MVLTRARPRPALAVVVPDEQTWTVLGRDPAALGIQPTCDLGRAQRLLVPERLAPPLAAALRTLVAGMDGPTVERHDLEPGGGTDVGSVLAAEPENGENRQMDHGHGEMGHGDMDHGHGEMDHGHGEMDHGHGEMDHGHGEMDHGHGEMDHGHGEMDHGDMMAIVGDPSADGLVMESIELRLGPLATPLPGGLTLDVTLDGDVVSEASFTGGLTAEPGGGTEPAAGTVPAAPDLLAPVAWSASIALAAEDRGTSRRWPGIAAVELERAVSHLAWLRAFARLLGWKRGVDRAGAVVRLVAEVRASLPGAPAAGGRLADRERASLRAAASAAQALVALLDTDAGLRRRTSGRGRLSAEEVRARGLVGPIARACGVAQDARRADPAYAELGFEPALREDGDARARALLRAEEAEVALALAAAALARAAEGGPPPADAAVEGPRGPLLATRDGDGWRLAAPGSTAARKVAAEAMVGAEWASALVVAASFDLSPWEVAG